MKSLDRLIRILELVTADGPEMTIMDISESLGMSRSATHRLLTALLEEELITRDGEAKIYRPGPRLQALARHPTALSIVDLAKPTLTHLRNETGETVGLSVRQGLNRVVVDQVESLHSLRRTYTDLGAPIPIHQGAPGKMLIAVAPVEVRERILQAPLEAATGSTITDSISLRKEIEEIARLGYATSRGERVEGIHTVATPVYNARGLGMAAISVTGPATRFTLERVEEAVEAARTAAHRLSDLIGYPVGSGIRS